MPELTKHADRAELTRRMERAEKLLQKGKATEALEEYLVVLRDDPENDTVRQLTADLCLSQNRARDAVRLLGELFERQVIAGDATRASLTYKKLARHGSPTWEQKFRFGQLLDVGREATWVESNGAEGKWAEDVPNEPCLELRRNTGFVGLVSGHVRK